MNKCYWKNGADRPDGCTVATNLQFIKKKILSVKHNKKSAIKCTIPLSVIIFQLIPWSSHPFFNILSVIVLIYEMVWFLCVTLPEKLKQLSHKIFTEPLLY